MTTLELAEKIARAVLKEVDGAESALLPHDFYCTDEPDFGGRRTDLPYAVLRVLHENSSWFCRNPTEDWHEEKEERYEQVELFK
jgi:hypothetical protein